MGSDSVLISLTGDRVFLHEGAALHGFGEAVVPQLPQISVAANSSGYEGSPVSVRVSLSFPTASAVTFSYATVNGTAVAGTDFVPISSTGTIPALATYVDIPVSTFLRSGYQGIRLCTLNISAAFAGSVALAISSASGTVRILDTESGGAHDYFNTWSTHPTAHKVQSLLLTDAQLRYLTESGAQRTLSAAPEWVYDPVNDTHPEAQDALKMTVDRMSTNNPLVRTWNVQFQPFIRIPEIAAPDRLLYSWDWYWTNEYFDTYGNIYGYKAFQTCIKAQNGSAGGWWTHCNPPAVAPSPNRARYRDAVRTTTKYPPRAAHGVLNGGDDYLTPGGNPGSGPTYLQGSSVNGSGSGDLAYPIPRSTWLRYWVELIPGQPASAFIDWNNYYGVTVQPNIEDPDGLWFMMSLWVASETHGVQRLTYRMPVGNGNYLHVIKAFRFEMNSSKYGSTGPLYGYGRHFMSWKNYEFADPDNPDSDPIFEQPTR